MEDSRRQERKLLKPTKLHRKIRDAQEDRTDLPYIHIACNREQEEK
jgi:hypothetical protein